jgi:hypothetical protein
LASGRPLRYADREAGYSIAYPSDWSPAEVAIDPEMEDLIRGVEFKDEAGLTRVWVYLFANPANEPLGRWIVEHAEITPGEAIPFSRATIADVGALVSNVHKSRFPTDATYVEKGQYVFAIAGLTASDYERAVAGFQFHLGEPPGAAAEGNMFAALYRHQFTHNASAQQQGAGTFFIATSSSGSYEDPDPAVVARFAGNEPPVKPVSMAVISDYSGVTDAATGESSVIFVAYDVIWLSKSEAEVKGGYYEGGLSASSNVYRIELIDGSWTVTLDDMISIS